MASAGKSKVSTAIGSIVDPKKIESGKPPVILEAQIVGFIPLKTREELKQWEDDLKTQFGMSLDASLLPGIASECCCVNPDGRYVSDRCDIESVLA
jgi:hypothetical protein